MTATTTRRAMIAGLAAAAPFAGLPTIVAPAELDGLIAAHRAAVAAFHEAIDDLARAEGLAAQDKSLRLAPDLLNGGGFDMDKFSRDDCLAVLAKEYKTHRLMLAGLARVAPALADEAKAALIAKEAENAEAIDAAFREEEARLEACGLAGARRRWWGTETAERAAALALCSYRCRTLDEATRRAAYLLSTPLCDEAFEAESPAGAFLASFVAGREA